MSATMLAVAAASGVLLAVAGLGWDARRRRRRYERRRAARGGYLDLRPRPFTIWDPEEGEPSELMLRALRRRTRGRV